MRKIIIFTVFLILGIQQLYSQGLRGGEIMVHPQDQWKTRFRVEANIYYDSLHHVKSPIHILQSGALLTLFTNTITQIDSNVWVATYYRDSVSSGLWVGSTTTFKVYDDSIYVENIINVKSNHLPSFIATVYDLSSGFPPDATPKFGTYHTDIKYNKGVYEHDIGAYDPDGDSIFYEIYYPEDTSSGLLPLPPNFTLSQDGKLRWDTLTPEGRYLVMIRVMDYIPNVTFLHQIYRTMVIDVKHDMITNTENPKQTSLFTLFPNPTTSTITIATPNFKNKTLTLYSMLGEALEMHRLTSPQHELDLSRYAAGMYIVQLSDGRQVWSKKVVKW